MSHPHYSTLSSLTDISQHLTQMDEETLVIFDVDMVLTHPKSPAFQLPNIMKYQHYLKEILKPLSPLHHELSFVCAIINSGSCLLDEGFPKFMQQISDKKAKKMALTACHTGPLGEIHSLEEWRFQTLVDLGIDFSCDFSKLPDRIIFDDLTQFREQYPSFHKGILYSNGEMFPPSKGVVLERFLQESDWKPNKIIFIDDKPSNLLSVKKTADKYHLDYLGIHFTQAERVAVSMIPKETFCAHWEYITQFAKKFLTQN